MKIKKPKILFIEDDKDQASIYKTKFELEGFECLWACNGEEGLKAARDDRPGLIFLDIIMPGENGLEILKKLKKDDATKNIPTVLFSNLSNKSSWEEGRKLGAIAYFVKTDISLRELVEWARKNVK